MCKLQSKKDHSAFSQYSYLQYPEYRYVELINESDHDREMQDTEEENQQGISATFTTFFNLFWIL